MQLPVQENFIVFGHRNCLVRISLTSVVSLPEFRLLAKGSMVMVVGVVVGVYGMEGERY